MRRLTASSCRRSRVLCGEPLENHKDGRPGQHPFTVSRRAGPVRRGAPFVPDALTGILVYFQGSSEWLAGWVFGRSSCTSPYRLGVAQFKYKAGLIYMVLRTFELVGE